MLRKISTLLLIVFTVCLYSSDSLTVSGRIVSMFGNGISFAKITTVEGVSTLANTNGYYSIKISMDDTPIDNFEIDPVEYKNYSVKIFNLIGQKVFDEKYQNTSFKSFSWNGYDKSGNQLSSGIYFSILEINNKILYRSKITIVGNEVLNKFPFLTFNNSQQNIPSLSKTTEIEQFLFDIEGEGFNALVDYPVNASSDGENNYSAEDIEVNLLPIPDFLISPEFGSVDTIFTFDASVSSDPDNDDDEMQFRWDLGNDGSWEQDFSTTATFSHQFADTGEYFIRLMVKDIDGETAEIVKNLYVIENPAVKPTAVLNITPLAGTIETDFTLDISESHHAGENDDDLVARWDWDNDGSWDTEFSTQKTFVKNYDTLGKYIIRVEVKDLNDQRDIDIDSLEVLNTPPIAMLSVSPDTVYEGEMVTFDATGSEDLEDKTDIDVMFDNGNGTWAPGTLDKFQSRAIYPLIETSSVHYTIRVKITDSHGAETIAQKTLTVLQVPNTGPVAGFIVTPDSGTTMTPFTFDASTSTDEDDPIDSLRFKWDFENDGVWDTEYDHTNTITHQFDTSAVYTIKLSVMDTDGAEDQTTVSVKVTNDIQTGTVTDIDGNIYKTVKIGDQWWMAENLRVTRYRNGEDIDTLQCWNPDDSLLTLLGRFYSWDIATDYHYIAPEGWHVPNNEEWEQLISFLGSQAGNKLKSTTGWNDGKNGTDEWEFNGYPAGEANYVEHSQISYFYNQGEQANYWSRDKNGTGGSHYYLQANSPSLNHFGWGQNTTTKGYSIRCVKGEYEPDTENPVITIINPTEGEEISYYVMFNSVRVTATDNIVVTHVVFEIDSAGSFVKIGEDNNHDNNEFVIYFDSRTYANGAHTIRATAFDVSGNSATATVNITINNFIIDTGTMTDVDGNVYKTVKIGDYWWMAENLKVTRFRNGSFIPEGQISTYNGNNYIDTYGRLYTWDAAKDVQQLAPEGWHIPTISEVQQLLPYVNTASGYLLKSTTGWENGGNGVDYYGFNALPGGKSLDGNWVQYIGTNAYFLTATEYPGDKLVYWSISTADRAYDFPGLQTDFYSIRCIRDYETDEVDPYVIFASPTDEDVVSNYIDISVLADDNVGVTSVKFEYIKDEILTQIGTDAIPENGNEFSLSWNTREVENGNYSIKVTAYDAEGNYAYKYISITIDNPVFETGTVTDNDENVYITVKIGDQWWMAENLKVETFRNGDGILADKVYGNNDSNEDIYGRLYTWNDVNDSREIAPEGWHIPTETEFRTLLDYIGIHPGTKLKSTSGWNNDGNGTDDFGFAGLPGGYMESDGNSTGLGIYASFWTATEIDANGAASFFLAANNTEEIYGSSHKWRCLSIRCVRDAD
ncbi:MAG: gliding motility-associated C-terminal domain-containing protein [Candidatus Marinimicrobia bacterium]|nr:gliding motility-associated C-terminal domain-containing protein [Candidatus Neomarinimicrobiota bacterium]